jgi:phosphinothricin acetyltransferase
VAERGEEILGYAYAGAFRARAAYQWSAETTIYLAQSAHRLGLGRTLYSHLLAILKQQGFHGAFGGITLPNGASTGLHEKLGFRQVGQYPRAGYKLGQWYDVGTWYLELNPPHPVESLKAAHDLDVFLSPVRIGPLS